jgi:hypothetical protein
MGADDQAKDWALLQRKIADVMKQIGREDPFGGGDYLIVDDNYGWERHTVEVHDLKVLTPDVTRKLQQLLNGFPGWEIVLAIDVPGTENVWPRMGLTIRGDGIIDDLRREYLPKAFEHVQFR